MHPRRLSAEGDEGHVGLAPTPPNLVQYVNTISPARRLATGRADAESRRRDTSEQGCPAEIDDASQGR